jgi:CheY-like chemotaxis protein
MTARILVAEDDEAIRELLATFLEEEVYTVLRAREGQEAATQLAHHGYDLLLTDQMMPELLGLELIAPMRTAPGRVVPAILVSASRPETAPPIVFLPKPFALTALLSVVARLLAPACCPPARGVLQRHVPCWMHATFPESLRRR